MLKGFALIAQWIEQSRPKREMRVRFLLRALVVRKFGKAAEGWCVQVPLPKWYLYDILAGFLKKS